MGVSKAWDWERETGAIWREPSEEAYYLAARWKGLGYRTLLDFGCGLGRHAVYFAKQEFKVSAFDLSDKAVASTERWAAEEKLPIRAEVGDMLCPPYGDGGFDCVFAYHVISHTDTQGARAIMAQIGRILRPGGEVFLTLCSKDAWSYRKAGFPRLDENTVVKTEEGPENGIPHFFVSMDDLLQLLDGFELERVRHIDDCWFGGQQQGGRHYFVLARRPGRGKA